VRDRTLTFAVGIDQCLLSFAFIGMGLSGSPVAVIFGLWGLINTFALLSSGILPRISSLVWHLLFVGSVFVSALTKPLTNPSDKTLLLWALVDLAAIFYLVNVTRRYVRNRSNPQ